MSEDDLPVFFEHQCDPVAAGMAAFAPREHAAFLAHWRRILGDASTVNRTVVVGGRVAGYVVCFEWDGQRQVGYWIGREFWGRGVATRALAAFLEQVPARPLHACVARHNVGSIRVLEKCGFRVSGETPCPDAGDAAEPAELTLILGPARSDCA